MHTLIRDLGLQSSTWKTWVGIRVIRKVRKTQHQNPEFGHTQGENFFLNLKKKSTLAFNGG